MEVDEIGYHGVVYVPKCLLGHTDLLRVGDLHLDRDHGADQYIRHAAGTGGSASEIEKAKQLLDNGTITQAEFEAIKAKVLS
jgi:hypothetical protein